MLHGRKRILVVGSGGAGKSTFARKLAGATGLPLIHLDQEYWQPGWTPTSKDVWVGRVAELIKGEAWIMDGNYGTTLPIRVQRCDAVVFFDMPRHLCFRGVLRRLIVHQFKPRPDVPAGCPEHVDMVFLRWIWNYPRNSRPLIEAALGQADPSTLIVRVTNRREVKRVLNAEPAQDVTD